MKDILRLSVPLTLWIAAFSAVYGLEGVVCSRHGAGLAPGQGRTVLVAAWLAAVAVQAGLLFGLRTPRFASPSRFVQGLSLSLAVVALVATIWTLFPVAVVGLCE